MFEQLFPNYLYCDTVQILPDGSIQVQKKKKNHLQIFKRDFGKNTY